MPTTSNFGWTTPADTDLVKDGAAAIRTLGDGVDTSLVDLKGGTTGQILSKASNTDLDYTWIANDQGDVTEVQAGTGISVADGTGPIPIVTNTMATEITAKGDLIVGTGSGTFDNLAAGTNGYTLVADSAETTGLKWVAAASGGMTLISTTTLSGASVTLTSIPSTYYSLQLVVRNYRPATDAASLYLRFNADSNANRHSASISNDLFGGGQAFAVTSVFGSNASDNGASQSLIFIDILDYANTSTWKMLRFDGLTNNETTTTNLNLRRGVGIYNQTSAISSFELFPSSGNFTSGEVLLYGVK